MNLMPAASRACRILATDPGATLPRTGQALNAVPRQRATSFVGDPKIADVRVNGPLSAARAS
jgi:hypothetical protein